MAKGLQSVKVLVNWGPFGQKKFSKKSHNADKNFVHSDKNHSVAKLQKIEEDPLGIFSKKNSLTMPKNSKEGPFILARNCVLRGKKRKSLFGSLPWANRYNLKFCRTILVTSGVSKTTLTKSHDYSRLLSQEKRRLKTTVQHPRN